MSFNKIKIGLRQKLVIILTIIVLLVSISVAVSGVDKGVNILSQSGQCMSCDSMSTSNEMAETMYYNYDKYAGELGDAYLSPYVSPVKNQGEHGTCWAFSSSAALETIFKKAGIAGYGIGEDGWYDFSEASLSYEQTLECKRCGSHKVEYKTTEVSSPSYFSKKEYVCKDCGGDVYGAIRDYGVGIGEGNEKTLYAAALQAQNTLALEKDWQTPVNGGYPDKPMDIEYYPVTVTDLVEINSSNMDDMKRAIMSYGSLVCAFRITYEAMLSYDVDSTSIEYDTMCAGNTLLNSGGHSMQVIGWDDNYGKENFKFSLLFYDAHNTMDIIQKQCEAYGIDSLQCKLYLSMLGLESYEQWKQYYDVYDNDRDFLDNNTKIAVDELEMLINAAYAPKKNGAYLVKNSWGTDGYASSGYVWVSYEDSAFLPSSRNPNAFAYAGIAVGNQNMYSHDENGSVGYVSPSNEYSNENYSIANIYDFQNNYEINTVGFALRSANKVSYTLSYAPVVEGKILLDKKVELTKGVNGDNAYMTIHLDDKIIPKGMGAIILSVSGRSKIYVGADFDKIEYSVNMYEVRKTIYKSFVGTGESYFIYEDAQVNTYDVIDTNANFAIRASVKASDLAPIHISADLTGYNRVASLADKLLEEKRYTSNSWKNYVDAKSNLETVLSESSYYTQNSLDSAVIAVEEAVAQLEFIDMQANAYFGWLQWYWCLLAIVISAVIATIIIAIAMFNWHKKVCE